MQEEGNAAAGLCSVPWQLLHSAQASSGPQLPSWEQLGQQREGFRIQSCQAEAIGSQLAGPATQADSEMTGKLLSVLRTSSFLLSFNLGDVASGTFLLLQSLSLSGGVSH